MERIFVLTFDNPKDGVYPDEESNGAFEASFKAINANANLITEAPKTTFKITVDAIPESVIEAVKTGLAEGGRALLADVTRYPGGTKDVDRRTGA